MFSFFQSFLGSINGFCLEVLKGVESHQAMGGTFSIQVSSVFIGSNFALAAFNFLKEYIDNASQILKNTTITLSILSSLFCLVASSWFYWLLPNNESHAFFFVMSIFSLCAVYGIILGLVIYTATKGFHIQIKSTEIEEQIIDEGTKPAQ